MAKYPEKELHKLLDFSIQNPSFLGELVDNRGRPRRLKAVLAREGFDLDSREFQAVEQELGNLQGRTDEQLVRQLRGKRKELRGIRWR
jgi:hypothetical protein